MRGLYTYWRSIEEECQSEVRATSLNLCTSTPLSSRTLTDFNLPNLLKGLLAPQAEPVIDIDETSASSNDTFNRGSSPAQTNEVFQESPPISPNKNLIGNPLGSCEAPYICEKPLTGNTLPSCSSDIFLRVTVNRLKERVVRESTPTKRLTVTPTKPILSVPVINQPKRLILTPTKRLLSVPLTNLPKRTNTRSVYPNPVLTSEETISWLKQKEISKNVQRIGYV